MNVSQAKITLKITLSLSFLFYVESIKEFKLDTFRINDGEMSYEMVVLCVTRKVSNYLRHYANLVPLLPQQKINKYKIISKG